MVKVLPRDSYKRQIKWILFDKERKSCNDENGVNIGGPPPNPLRQLTVNSEGEELIITKKSVE